MSTTTIDKYLFGLKDFGALTLPELADIFADIATSYSPHIHDTYTSQAGGSDNKRICLFVDYLYVDYSHEAYAIKSGKKPIRSCGGGAPVIEKMLANMTDADLTYNVKIELTLNDPERVKRGECMACVKVDFWVDNFAIWSTEWLHSHLKYQTEGVVPTVNAAHNKYIHTLHYAEFKENMTRIKEELISTAMHPRRLMRHLDLGGEIDDF